MGVVELEQVAGGVVELEQKVVVVVSVWMIVVVVPDWTGVVVAVVEQLAAGTVTLGYLTKGSQVFSLKSGHQGLAQGSTEQ